MAEYKRNPNHPNLIIPSHEQASRNGRKGAIASAEARRKRTSLGDLIRRALTSKTPDKDARKELEKYGLPSDLEGEIILSALKNAKNGDLTAFALIRDTIGESPRRDVGITLDPASPSDFDRLPEAELRRLAAADPEGLPALPEADTEG